MSWTDEVSNDDTVDDELRSFARSFLGEFKMLMSSRGAGSGRAGDNADPIETPGFAAPHAEIQAPDGADPNLAGSTQQSEASGFDPSQGASAPQEATEVFLDESKREYRQTNIDRFVEKSASPVFVPPPPPPTRLPISLSTAPTNQICFEIPAPLPSSAEAGSKQDSPAERKSPDEAILENVVVKNLDTGEKTNLLEASKRMRFKTIFQYFTGKNKSDSSSSAYLDAPNAQQKQQPPQQRNRSLSTQHQQQQSQSQSINYPTSQTQFPLQQHQYHIQPPKIRK